MLWIRCDQACESSVDVGYGIQVGFAYLRSFAEFQVLVPSFVVLPVGQLRQLRVDVLVQRVFPYPPGAALVLRLG